MDWGSEGHFRTFFPGMTEFIAILQLFRPGGLKCVARQRRDASRRADLRVHEAHRVADDVTVPQTLLEQ